MLGSQTQTPPKDSVRPSRPETTNTAKARYFLTWRWHFYAGLFAIPFMIMLSITGLIMLFDDEIEQLRYSDIIYVIPQERVKPVSKQLMAVKQAYPSAKITQYVSSNREDLAHRFNVKLADGKSILVTVNPYNAEIIGEIDRSDSWYQLANDIHGNLLIGKWGDYLIEVSASLGILLLVSGLYLWLPQDNASKTGFLKLRFNAGTRVFMRDLHANLGGTLSLVLLLFLLSGLAWAGVWGAKMVQGWNTFPTYYTWGEKPQSALTHAQLNHGSEEEMPWNLEQATVPESKGHHSAPHEHQTDKPYNFEHGIGIDEIIAKAKALGFTQFKVYLPQSDTGVFTVSSNSMAGDVTDPRKDRTTHFDQYTGNVLVDVTWQDYSLVAKAMAAGVSLHQGDLTIINKVLNVVFCLAFIAISVTGAMMWWVRRPAKQNKLGVPTRFEQDGIWKLGMISLILVSLMFPLAGISIVLALVIDTLVVRNSPKLRAYLS